MSGLDLKESKEFVERLEAELRTAHPERFTAARTNAGGCLVSVIVMLLAAAGLIWWFWLRGRSAQ